MNKIRRIATLGPPGTFSDAAALKYAATQGDPHEVMYFPTIGSSIKSIGKTCEVGVLPIENFSEGFIPLVLDQLVDADLMIVYEVMLPIQFSLVSMVKDLAEIHQLFVQFVAKGQCIDFIETLGEIKIVATESNIESLESVQCADGQSAAIVPSSSFSPNDFVTVVENVNDHQNNQTRFLALSGCKNVLEEIEDEEYKTSIVVLDDNDHPGLLGEILHSFSSRKINLISIISRPTCREFGKYHFFIDLDGHIHDPKISYALEEICKINKVKFLGSYPKGKLYK